MCILFQIIVSEKLQNIFEQFWNWSWFNFSFWLNFAVKQVIGNDVNISREYFLILINKSNFVSYFSGQIANYELLFAIIQFIRSI